MHKTMLDPVGMSPAAVYRLMTSAIVPRPIAWVGTNDGTGTPGGDNLAPFSYFMGVSSNPPLLAISVARGPGGAIKDTARNILATGQFSVTIPRASDLDAVNLTAAAWPGSEFEAAHLAPEPGVRIAAPHPADAAFTFECVLHQAIDLGSTHLLVGRVVLFLAEGSVLEDGVVSIAALAPIARLGGEAFAEVGALHHRARVSLGGPGSRGSGG